MITDGMKRNRCVWVLEMAVLAADMKSDRIQEWVIWESHNTRSEAVKARNSYKSIPKKHWRIVKYVPAVTR